MTTTITGNETKTPDTDTDTLSGGLTNGQIVRALFGNGLTLNGAGEIVVKNSEQVGGQSVQELLGAFSFSGEALVGDGGGEVLAARTDASGDRTRITINPRHDYPDGTILDGDIIVAGILISEGDAAIKSPFILDDSHQRPEQSTLFQLRDVNQIPHFTVENGEAAQTTLLNGTLTVGGDTRAGHTNDSTGKRVRFGNTLAQIRGDNNGGLVARDTAGNLKTII